MGAIGEGSGVGTLGQRATSAIGASRKQPQFTGELVYISANVVPLTAMIDKMRNSKEVAGTSYFHLETDELPTVVLIDGTGYPTTSTATIGLASGHSARLTVGTTLKNLRTGEQLRVTSVTSDSNIGVTRQFASTPSGTLVANEEIAIISHCDTEGNTSPAGQSSEPTQKLNYVQCMREAWEASRRVKGSAVYGGDEMPRLQKAKLKKIRLDMERAMWFNSGVNSSNPTQTGGVEYWLSTNVTNVAGTLTETSLIDNLIRPAFRRNDGEDKSIYCFCGELFARALDGFGRDAIRYGTDDMGIGIEVRSYRTIYGTLQFVRHGLFTNIGSTVSSANNGWQGYAVALNMNLVGNRYFKNSKLKLRQNIQENDRDGEKHEYLVDVGFYLASEQQHVLLKGITG